MKHLLIILTVFISSALILQSEIGSKNVVKDVPIKEEDGSRPIGCRAPARIPVSAFLLGDCLTIITEYETDGEIKVTDILSGNIVAEESNELSQSVSILLPYYIEGNMELRIKMNGKNYVGYF